MVEDVRRQDGHVLRLAQRLAAGLVRLHREVIVIQGGIVTLVGECLAVQESVGLAPVQRSVLIVNDRSLTWATPSTESSRVVRRASRNHHLAGQGSPRGLGALQELQAILAIFRRGGALRSTSKSASPSENQPRAEDD